MRKIEIKHQAFWLTSLLLAPTMLVASHATAADSAPSSDLLLNLFVEKGYVSKSEADKVKAEAEKRQAELNQYKETAAALKAETEELRAEVATLRAQADFSSTNDLPALEKSKMSNALDKMVFFGDIRLRYESREATDPKGGKISLSRERYSVRLGLRGDVFENFSYGVKLESSSNPRSSFNTFGNSSSGGSTYQGPFGKSTAGLNISQAYISWQHDDWVNITFGKMPNPLYVTPMVWSSSINPEGAAETFKSTVGEADLFATFGQFIYEDTNPNQASPGYFGVQNIQNPGNLYSGNGTPIFLLAWQAGLNYHFTKDISLKVAPVFYYYSGNGANTYQTLNGVTPGFNNTYVGQGSTGGAAGYSGYPGGFYDGFTANQTGINDLKVLEIPVELNWSVSKMHLRFFGDYAYNLKGADRANAAYTASQAGQSVPGGTQTYAIQPIASPQTSDVKAYQIGFGIGSTNLVYGPMQGLVYGNSSKKNAWELRTYWQHIEQYSLDPNLIDADFFNSNENMEGFYAALAYGLSDNVIATVRYGYAERINNQLGTGGGAGLDIPQMNPIQKYHLFQLDLGVKF
jgi:hypothetical protein